MRLVFEKIRWKNFLSTGNTWVEIDLTKSKTTLICGDNGHGKSTFLDAFSYVNFDQPFRKVSKTKLANSINNKNCVVEEEFSIGDTRYMIRRGMKPGIFEIYRNGELYKIPADLGDSQEFLENHLLKMGSKLSSQIITLGAATFTPFMKLKAAERRAIVEDLLGIEIFTVMNAIHKDNLNANKEAIQETESKLLNATSKVDMQKKHIISLKSMTYQAQEQKQQNLKKYHDDRITTNDRIAELESHKLKIQPIVENCQKKVSELENQYKVLADLKEKRAKREELRIQVSTNFGLLADANKQVNKLTNACNNIQYNIDCVVGELEKMEPLYEGFKKATDLKASLFVAEVNIENLQHQIKKFPNITELKSQYQKTLEDVAGMIAGFQERERRAQSELKFFNENDTCVTCTQPIPNDFKTNIVNKNKTLLSQSQEALNKLTGKRASLQNNLADLAEQEKNLKKLQDELREAQYTKETCLRDLKGLPEEDLAHFGLKIDSRKNHLKAFKSHLAQLENELQLYKNGAVRYETNLSHANEAFNEADRYLSKFDKVIIESVEPKLMVALDEAKKEHEKNANQLEEINKGIVSFSEGRNQLSNFISTLESELEKLKEDAAKIDEESKVLTQLETEVSELTIHRNNLINNRLIMEVAGTLLKDDGAKSNVIKRYIPTINQCVNQYLGAMDFSCGFELDENFDETVKSRYRDEFKYEAFSEGEKLRIDLALLFTWREIAKRRSSASSNLLVMDEVLDRSLDQNGVEGLMKIIAHIKEDTNLFVISHRSDQVSDMFERTLHVVKRNNFSSVVDL